MAGGKPISTKAVTIAGDRHKLNPEWRYELWQPVTTPCMSGSVKVRCGVVRRTLRGTITYML